MTNSRASKGYELLDKHLATGTEATYTFTKTLDMKETYREVIVIITGKATAAFALILKINASTDYNNAQLLLDTTTVSGSVDASDTAIHVLPASIIDGATTFYSKITIVLNDAGDTLMAQSMSSAPHEGIVFRASDNQTASTSITSINTATSTSTWIAGTEISTYGLRR